jgi:hypothetical protein
MVKLSRQLTRWAFFLALGFLAGFEPSSARADILITLFGAPTKSGSDWTYTYNVFLNPGSELVSPSTAMSKKGGQNTPDLFTVYDFVGLVGTPTIIPSPPAPVPALSATGFSSPTIHLVGITPIFTAPTDDPLVDNFTFEYTSKTATKNPASGMNLYLGQFSAVSTFGPSSTANIYYAAATQKDVPGPTNGELANNVSLLVGPVIAEPPSLLLYGIALPLVGAFWHLRNRRLLLA